MDAKKLKMSSKKNTFFTVVNKMEITHLLKKGQPGKEIAKRYGVGAATISDIKKNSKSIQLFVSVL
jgi:uncharacterized protein YerC